MQVPFLDLKKQYLNLKTEIDAAIRDCIENTAFIQGKRVEKFEREFADYLEVKHVVGCSSGTCALFLALKVFGVGPGDEVITASNSFIATSEAITMTGAKVIFADVSPINNNITPELAEKLITDKTRAIIPVHLHGYPVDLNGFRVLAEKYGLKIIADSAQAHGAKLDNVPIAQLADITTYSFYPGKNLGAFGDAGAVAFNDDDLLEYIKKARNHGRAQKYIHDFEGYNMRMDEIQAAVLSAKLPFLADWIEKRRNLAARYDAVFKDVGDLILPPGLSNETYAVYHLYAVETAKRDQLKDYLSNSGIACGIHYPVPLPLQPAYSYLKMTSEQIPVAVDKSEKALSLPVYPEMTMEQQDYVIEKVKEFFSR
jgi:dTDP-4-amino-4,6-dideoxygalactose transaminase